MNIRSNSGRRSIGLRCVAIPSAVLLVSLAVGCDTGAINKCRNNPCNNDTACDGVEKCTLDDGELEGFKCTDGTPRA